MKRYYRWFKKLYEEYGLFEAIIYTPYNAKYYDPDNLKGKSFGKIKEVSLCGGETGSTGVESTKQSKRKR